MRAAGYQALMALFILTPASPSGAANVVVKMATLAPKGSAWHLILLEMGEKWKAASGGSVTLTIYPGMVAGDDADVVRKMRLGTLNAALLTSVGMANIDRSIYSLQVPMMYESYEELDYVLERQSPNLKKEYESRGFVILTWADGGWIHFFTKTPVRTPDDMKPLKLFAWAGDNEAIEIWKAAGFQPVPLPSTEISTALKTGLVNALSTTLKAAVIFQWYTHAKHMTDLQWTALLGAVVISKPAWEKIPAAVRPALLEAAREAGAKMRREIRQSGPKEIEAMTKRGLTVVRLNPEEVAAWRAATEAIYSKIRGSIAPARAFDEAMKYRNEYRKGGSAPPAR
ncbi:MAG: hypothetical protein A3G34_16055 [Candidatus Lindowbacteria bacterium RIFCSPLOWO2_12_FULL_62_27]|nr:MAG: hypothetical protein A3G34_16055 [Candidatus Lindowbacteria bacterium RIFCSPLOWO2_12_FULL_62_27]